MCKIQLTMNGKDVPKLLISDALPFTYIFGKDIPANDSEIINFIVVQRMIMIIKVSVKQLQQIIMTCFVPLVVSVVTIVIWPASANNVSVHVSLYDLHFKIFVHL